MTSDALWLLKRQSFLIAREQVLLRLIHTVDNAVPSDEEIIDGITFARATGETVQKTSSHSSKTEYVALNLESLRADRMEVQERRTEQWHKELQLIRNWLAILDAAMLVLTPEERMLADRYFREGKSVEILSQTPLLDVTRSRSTLKRMLKVIVQKVEEVVTQEEGYNILPRI